MIFLHSASSAAALVFYLPGECTHTDIKRKQRKARVRNILKSSEKNTIFNEHLIPIYLVMLCVIEAVQISKIMLAKQLTQISYEESTLDCFQVRLFKTKQN